MRHLPQLQGFSRSIRDLIPGLSGSCAGINSALGATTSNWFRGGYDDVAGVYAYTSRRIVDINESIILGVSYASGSYNLYYAKNLGVNNGGDYSTFRDPINRGLALIANGGTFSVSNLDYVDFGAEGSFGGFAFILNRSENNRIVGSVDVRITF
jgi:hypothetical protein